MTVQVLEYGAPGQFESPSTQPPGQAAPLELQPAPKTPATMPDQGAIVTSRPGETERQLAKPITKPAEPGRARGGSFAGSGRSNSTLKNLNKALDAGGGFEAGWANSPELQGTLQGLVGGLLGLDSPAAREAIDPDLRPNVELGLDWGNQIREEIIGAGERVREIVDDIQWPEIEAPEINWPEIEAPQPDPIAWPEINWPDPGNITIPKPPEINWPWDWPEENPIVEPAPSPSPEPAPSPTPEPAPSPSPGVDPSDYPPGGWQPFPEQFKECTITIYTKTHYSGIRCYFSVISEGRTFPYGPNTGPETPLTPSTNPNVHRSGGIANQQYEYVGGYQGDGIPQEFRVQDSGSWTILPDSRNPGIFQSRYSDYKFDPIRMGTALVSKPPMATPEYNVCFDNSNAPSTGKVSPAAITGYAMSCPFPITNPPSIDDLNRPPGNAPPQSPLPPPPLPEPPNDMNCCSCDDIKRMLRSLKGKVKIPKVTCEQVEEDGVLIWKPTIEEEEIELIAVDEATLKGIAGHYTKLAEMQEAQCNARNWTDFAINVPKSVLNPPDGNLFEQVWDWITPDETLEIKTAPELIRWSIEQLSGMLGDWGQKIVIPGDEEGDGEFYVPDLATGISQILIKLQALQDDENAIVSLGTRGIFEASMARQQAIQTNYGIEAVLQFLSAKIKRDKIDIPITFSKPNPSEIDDIDTRQELENFLENSTLPVPIIKYDDSRDLKDDLKPLLDAAGIIKAVFSIGYKQNASDEELGAMLRDLIKSHRAPVDTARNDEDWDAWINKVEQGFTTEPGITDPINPYGRDLTHRPRIREIGTDQADV